MEYRTLGKTGWEISEVSFGTWALGGSWGRVVDEREALSALSYAMERGVNFFDTADVYGDGRSEEFLGKACGRRQDIIIATKFCRAGDISDPLTYSYDQTKAYAVGSLKRLQRDRIDLYQIHCPPAWVIEQGEVFQVLDRLKEEGLIRHYGVSVETVDEGLKAMTYPHVSTLQVILNIFRQKVVSELLPQAVSHKVGILARVPLASGLLSGKFHAGDTFAADDHRHFNRDGAAFNVGETFAGLPFAKGVELVEKIRWIAQGRPNMAAAALRWILDQPGVSSVIPGFKNIRQIDQNLSALDAASFTDEELTELRDFYRSSVADHIRGAY